MRQIELPIGCNLKEAVEILIEHNISGESVYAVFNSFILESDNISLNKAYLTCTGKNYGDFEEMLLRSKLKNDKSEREFQEIIPELTEKYIAAGKEILDKKYWDEWAKCVPIRLNDLYHGMELQCCLDIVKELNEGCSLEYAKKVIDSQDHSGMSYSLVLSMVKAFCDRGGYFAEFCKL